MPSRRFILFLAIMGAVALPAAAQEAQDVHWSSPIGLTQSNTLRVEFMPVTPRVAFAPTFVGVCNATVAITILDATNLQVLLDEPAASISIGVGKVLDFLPAVSPPPARREVLVKVVLTRTPTKSAERGSLARVCPIAGSAQVFNNVSGETLAYVNNMLGDDRYFGY